VMLDAQTPGLCRSCPQRSLRHRRNRSDRRRRWSAVVRPLLVGLFGDANQDPGDASGPKDSGADWAEGSEFQPLLNAVFDVQILGLLDDVKCVRGRRTLTEIPARLAKNS
jgi:hypothetical protein